MRHFLPIKSNLANSVLIQAPTGTLKRISMFSKSEIAPLTSPKYNFMKKLGFLVLVFLLILQNIQLIKSQTLEVQEYTVTQNGITGQEGMLDYFLNLAAEDLKTKDVVIYLNINASGDNALITITRNFSFSPNSPIGKLMFRPHPDAISNQGFTDGVAQTATFSINTPYVSFENLYFRSYWGTNDAFYVTGGTLLIDNCKFENNYGTIIHVRTPNLIFTSNSVNSGRVEFEAVYNDGNISGNTVDGNGKMWISNESGSSLLAIEDNTFQEDVSIISYSNTGSLLLRNNNFIHGSSDNFLVGVNSTWQITGNSFAGRNIYFQNSYNLLYDFKFDETNQTNSWGTSGSSKPIFATVFNNLENRLFFESQLVYGNINIRTTNQSLKSGVVIRKCKILNTQIKDQPIIHIEQGNNNIPAPSFVDLDLTGNQLTIDYELGDYSAYEPNLVVDFYLSNSNGDLVEYLGAGDVLSDPGTVTGTHQAVLDLSGLDPPVTVNKGDRIAATVTSLGTETVWGHGTSMAVYSPTAANCDILDFDGSGLCVGNTTPITLQGTPTGGEFFIDDNPTGSDVFDFIPSNYTAGEHTIKYAYNETAWEGCSTSEVVNITEPTLFSFPNSAECIGSTFTINLSGSEAGTTYTVYHNGNPTAVSQAGTGAGIDLEVTNALEGLYTVFGQLTGQPSSCNLQMNGEVLIDDPDIYDMTGSGYYCDPATQSVGLSGSEEGFRYQLVFEPKVTQDPPYLVMDQLIGTGGELNFSDVLYEIGTYYIQAINGGCTVRMNGELQIISLEVITIGWSTACSGTDLIITIPGSEINVEYDVRYSNGGPPAALPYSAMGTGADATITIPANEVNTGGTYMIAATHTQASCSMKWMDVFHTVNPSPVLNPISPTYCEPASIEIGTETTGQYQYRLNGGTWTDMPSGTFVPIVTGNNYDDYDFRYQSSNGCYSNIESTGIYIIPDNFTISLGATDNNCSSHSKTITVSNTQQNISYELIFTDTNNQSSTVDSDLGDGTALSFTHTPLVAGTYSVVAVNTPSNCSTTSTNSIVIYLTPSLSDVDPAYCSTTSPITLVGTPSGGSYEYELNGGGWLPLPSATITPGNTTEVRDDYRVQYTSVEGCVSVIRSTSIHGLPIASDLTLGATSQSCSTYPVTIEVSNPQVGVTYQLFDPNSDLADSETATGPVSLVDNPAITGIYSVVAYNNLQSCSNTMNNTIEVFATPTITTLIEEQYCSNQSSIALATSEAGGNFWLDDNINDGTDNYVDVGTSYSINPSTVVGVSQTKRIRYEINNCYHTYEYTLNKLPDVTNLLSPDPACSGRMLEFTLMGAEAGMNYMLKLDGADYSLQTATTDGQHIFRIALGETGQVYTVTGQSPNFSHPNMTGCYQDATGSATILQSPYVMVDDETVCENTTITLSSDPDDGGTFAYSSDQGGSWTNLSGNTFTTGTCGTTSCDYQMQYTASNNCDNAEEKTVTVYALPEDKVISSTNACAGNDVIITVENPQADVSYYLYKNGSLLTNIYPIYGDESGANISFTPDEAANVALNDEYSVKAYSGFGHCGLDMLTTITVGASPADVTGPIEGPPIVCIGETATFSVSEAGAYRWNVPNGYTIQSGQNTESIVVFIEDNAQAGDISVRRMSGSCTGAAISHSVGVNTKPEITGIIGNFTPCRLSDETYTAEGAAESYEWHYQYGPNWNLIGTGQEITTNVGGTVITYPVRVTGTNAGCPSVSFIQNISVIAPLTNAAGFTAITDICDGAGRQLTVDAGDYNPTYTYTWEVTGDLSASGTTGQSINITGNLNGGTTPGSGSVILSVTNGCGTPVASAPTNITVNPIPQITSITINERVECSEPPIDYGSATALIADYVPAEFTLTWPGGESGLTATQLTGNGDLIVTRNGCSNNQGFVIDNRPQFNVFPGGVPCGDNGLTADDHNNLYLRTIAPLEGFNYTYEITQGGPVLLQGPGTAPLGTDVNNITGLAGGGSYTINVTKENCPSPFTANFTLQPPVFTVTPESGNGVSLCDAQERLQINCNLPSFYTAGHDYQVTGIFKDQSFSINVVEETINNVTSYYIPIGTTVGIYGSGSYQLDIVDVTWGCTFQYEFAINPLTAYVIPEAATCNEDQDEDGNAEGFATVYASGGSGSFAYYWYTADDVLQSGKVSHTERLEAGTYYVIVEMLNGGCRFQTEPFTIEPAFPITDVTPNFDNTCNPQVSYTGGTAPYEVSWMRKETIVVGTYEASYDLMEFSIMTMENTASAANIPNGLYTIIVRDKYGCELSSAETEYNADRFAHEFDICISFNYEYEEPDPIEVPNPQGDQTLDLSASMDAVLNQAVNIVKSENEALYNENCLNNENIDDTLSLSYPDEYKQFTLYYYDRAGNLIQTMPPKAVNDFDMKDRSTEPGHEFGLGTQYKYNSLGQVIEQTSPDGGTSIFIYDKLGRLRFSQNAEQGLDPERPNKTIRWSYSIFDNLGRPEEAGELIDNISNTDLKALVEESIDGRTMPVSYQTATNITERIMTTYTSPGNVDYKGQNQRFLNNRVSFTRTHEGITSYYSYDPHGNVEWMVQELPDIGRHTLAYQYDLISGNVTKVIANEGRLDCFYHRYEYDDDNRLLKAYTSRDGELWDEDANYQYYAHGPLMRTQLGQDKVQGVNIQDKEPLLFTRSIPAKIKKIS